MESIVSTERPRNTALIGLGVAVGAVILTGIFDQIDMQVLSTEASDGGDSLNTIAHELNDLMNGGGDPEDPDHFSKVIRAAIKMFGAATVSGLFGTVTSLSVHWSTKQTRPAKIAMRPILDKVFRLFRGQQ